MDPIDFRIHASSATRPVTGEFVLYWIQVTQRATGNFALNFAIERANELQIPLVVYHGLRPDYPWANARFHTFILESAVDLSQRFSSRGIQYVFHLDRMPPQPLADRTAETLKHRVHASPLVQLARRAAMVVTDFYPTFIVPRQTRRLRQILEREAVAVPVVAVDSATLIPMAYFDRPFRTARAFRPALEAALPHFLHPVEKVEAAFDRPVDLGFDSSIRGSETSLEIAQLVASCPIDHSVAPALNIRGGTSEARRRLDHFIDTGLPRYTRDRHDPNEDATSRMSPYLHFGNISPHEILLRARETGPNNEYLKFKDELLTWRELSHNFVYHDPHHRTLAAAPEWSRRELTDHSDDARPVLYSLEQLERAETGDELWNAAQRSYLRDGYMHNYMRMLWGKSVLQWTSTPDEALRILEHLNNKYSLDGRDANTYGGIMWVFGKFDRPFYRRPIYGLVRYQSLKAAARKFDVARYIERIESPSLPGLDT